MSEEQKQLVYDPNLDNLRCPMCDAPIVSYEYQANNRRVENARGIIGFLPGDPGAQFDCLNGCEFKTKNRLALDRLLAKMGLREGATKSEVQRRAEFESVVLNRLAKLERKTSSTEDVVIDVFTIGEPQTGNTLVARWAVEPEPEVQR